MVRPAGAACRCVRPTRSAIGAATGRPATRYRSPYGFAKLTEHIEAHHPAPPDAQSRRNCCAPRPCSISGRASCAARAPSPAVGAAPTSVRWARTIPHAGRRARDHARGQRGQTARLIDMIDAENEGQLPDDYARSATLDRRAAKAAGLSQRPWRDASAQQARDRGDPRRTQAARGRTGDAAPRSSAASSIISTSTGLMIRPSGAKSRCSTRICCAAYRTTNFIDDFCLPPGRGDHIAQFWRSGGSTGAAAVLSAQRR